MTTLRRLKDVVALEQFGMVLTKAGSQAEIAQALDKIAYSTSILDQGNEFLEKAREKYMENIHNKDEYNYIQADFVKKKKEIDRIYRDHRRKVRLICIDEPRIEQNLAINGKYPRKYPLWLETVRKFYLIANREAKVQNKLLAIGLSKEEIKKGLSDIDKLEILLAEKMKRKGDFRLSTAEKNKAFKDMHKWMRIFFGAAKLALREEPELLGALERHVG